MQAVPSLALESSVQPRGCPAGIKVGEGEGALWPVLACDDSLYFLFFFFSPQSLVEEVVKET